LELPPELSIREFAGGGAHPLDTMQAVIVAKAGPGFVARMAARGVEVVITSQTDPALAVAQHCQGELRQPRNLESMQKGAMQAAEFLKAMANDTRLMVLCALLGGEKSVSELERSLELSQSRVSQQLARLRRAGLVANRPAGAAVYYRLSNPQARLIVDAVYDAYCKDRKALEQG
jgi:DNA-binding transcriptional ArsR family regulator